MNLPVFANSTAMLAALKPSTSVYCIHKHRLTTAAEHFLNVFPGKVLFAVKCNPHPEVLRILNKAGVTNFDTASLTEITLIANLFPDAGKFYMHPVKSEDAIRAAQNTFGVRHYVADHMTEVEKILSIVGEESSAILVRMATPSAGAAYELSTKFGARPEEAVEMLRRIKTAGKQTGIAFHVGSQCLYPHAFKMATEMVNTVLDGFDDEIDYLDVGGGFPAEYVGAETPPVEDFIEQLTAGLEALNLPKTCQLLCEPGRALVATGMSLVTQVHLRKNDRLYINDGIYGSISEPTACNIRYQANALRLDGKFSEEYIDYTIFGPTCDSLDVLPHPYSFPEDIREGDWIEFQSIGAYSNANRTHFNGIYPDTFVIIDKN